MPTFNGIPPLSGILIQGESQMGKAETKVKAEEIDRIIMMAWEDRTSFDAIQTQFGLTPGEVIHLMRREMKPSSFKMWRKRTPSSCSI